MGYFLPAIARYALQRVNILWRANRTIFFTDIPLLSLRPISRTGILTDAAGIGLHMANVYCLSKVSSAVACSCKRRQLAGQQDTGSRFWQIRCMSGRLLYIAILPCYNPVLPHDIVPRGSTEPYPSMTRYPARL